MRVFDGYEFWDNVSRILESKNMTNKELAEESGTLYRSITSQRTRHQIPGAVQLLMMAKVLGTTCESLLTGQSTDFCQEAKEVQSDHDLQALVRSIQRDRSLLSVVAAFIRSYENEKIG